MQGMKYSLVLMLMAGWSAWAADMAQDPVEYNNLGIQAYNAKQFEEAVKWFERAYRQARDNTVVRRNLCNAHQALADQLAKQNNLNGAVQHLTTAISVDPENPTPLIQLGAYCLRMDRVSDAIFRLEEAIELKPGELDAHELLGEAYYRDNDIPSARVQWDYVLQIDPNRKELRERYDKAFREENVETDFNRSGSRHFKISYPKGMAYPVRARVLNILEGAYWDIGRKLGGIYPPPPIQVIIYDATQFSEATQLDANIGAVYDGKIRAPMMDDAGQPLSEDELKRRLVHEYVHVVVRHRCGEKVPWWLNEGLAETLSREMEPAETGMLRNAYESGIAFHLAALEAHQLKALGPQALRLAYAQSHATVSLLWGRFGQNRMQPFLGDIASGISTEEALNRNYRKTYAKLEADVEAGIR